MKLNKIGMALSRMTGRTGLILKKYSPEILLAVGITGIVGSTVLACRATLKVEEVLERHHDKMDKIHEVVLLQQNQQVAMVEYSEEDHRKDVAVTYLQTAVDFIKLYGPAVTLGVFSIACIVGGHGIMKKRNVALVAAYKAVEEGFNAYRKRVVEEYGEEKDYAYKNGLKVEQVLDSEVGEDGKTRKVKTNKLAPIDGDPSNLSQYARFFDDGCKEWSKEPEYNLLFLRNQQSYFNELLKIRGHVFLNEVYDALGIPRTKAGSIVGWVIGGGGDNYIDFGIFDGDKPKSRDFVNGYERTILLDFNVDGVIYDLI